MNALLLFLAGVFVGAIGVYRLLSRKKTSGGIVSYIEERSSEKQSRKERIIATVKEKGTITNNDVEKLLGIADATATNYLQELEREGKIKQIGIQGRFVHYKIQ